MVAEDGIPTKARNPPPATTTRHHNPHPKAHKKTHISKHISKHKNAHIKGHPNTDTHKRAHKKGNHISQKTLIKSLGHKWFRFRVMSKQAHLWAWARTTASPRPIGQDGNTEIHICIPQKARPKPKPKFSREKSENHIIQHSIEKSKNETAWVGRWAGGRAPTVGLSTRPPPASSRNLALYHQATHPPVLPSAINGAWEPRTRRHKWRLSEED
jgi:hypothetical protein